MVTNPLIEKCKMLGFDVLEASRLAGVPFSSARQAMAEEPCGAIESYIKIMEAIGGEIRFRRAEPLRIWIDLAKLDALYFDNAFRKSQNLYPLPQSRYKLRRMVVRLRVRRRRSYERIVEYMQENHICTLEGVGTWRRGIVGKQLKNRRKRFLDDNEALKPAESAVNRWRELLVDKVLCEASGPNPFFRVHYGLKQTENNGRLHLVTTRVLTEKPREWFLERIAKIPWLNGAWAILPAEVLLESSP